MVLGLVGSAINVAAMKYFLRYLDWFASIVMPDHADEQSLQRARVLLYITQALAAIVLLGCALIIVSARSETPDEWLSIVTEIQRKPCAYKNNHADELFIVKMINLLTLDNPPEPTAAEKRWIITLKRECLK